MAKNELMVKENFELAINGEVADILGLIIFHGVFPLF